jgi:cytochrome oxidase Cu insertion factor (SCO1/SenC/PrrC family)
VFKTQYSHTPTLHFALRASSLSLFEQLANRVFQQSGRARITEMNQVIGQPFPDVELQNQDGQTVKLSQIAGKFPLIVTFYRGYW